MPRQMEQDRAAAAREFFMRYGPTQPLPAVPRRSRINNQVSGQPTPGHLPSYQPTGWTFVDRTLDSIDQITGGRADWFQRLFIYLLIGGCAAIVNLICFSIVYYHILRMASDPGRYLIAFTVATEISILANFIPNDYITFRYLPGHSRSWVARCLRFHVTCIGGTLLTLAISFSLLRLLHMEAILAQAIALIIATAFNFAFHHIFTYRRF